jgi:hypothetical protein
MPNPAIDTITVAEVMNVEFAMELFCRRKNIPMPCRKVASRFIAKNADLTWRQFCSAMETELPKLEAEVRCDPTPEELESGFEPEGIRLLKQVTKITGVEPRDVEDQTHWDGQVSFLAEGDKVRVIVELPNGGSLRGSFSPEEFISPPCGTDASLFPGGTPAKVACHVLTTIFGSRDFVTFGLFADGLFFDTPAEDNEVNFKVEVLATEKFELGD